MQETKSVQAGERTHEIGVQKYIVIRDTDGRELTKPMSWQDASVWAASPLTKATYPEGVVVAPASYPPSLPPTGKPERTQRTLGPWHTHKPKDSNGYVHVRNEKGMEACTCYYQNAEANARLIAAAPELLAACKALINGGEAPIESARHIDMTDAIQMIRAAIAKAEGTTH